ncbi:MAG: nitroreductase family protein, partial [archaeon]|nr:nitroreductase family protein [archaeon]
KEEGLGTCWVINFNEKATKEILGIPSDIRVVAMTPLGYPDEVKGEVHDRKPLEEILHFEHW